jgi:putative Mg2+ transporter-C (MgtC) family protein
MDEWIALFDEGVPEQVVVVLVKMGIGVLLAGAIGWERERQGRPAGIRTHMLMVLGVILFAESSKAFAQGDPTRIAAQIVTGVGFLGAGTIMRSGPSVKGLTTAASLWAAAGIGMAVSTGGAFLTVAIIATAMALFTLIVVNRLEHLFSRRSGSQELLVSMASRDTLVAVLGALVQAGVKVDAVRVSDEEDAIKATIETESSQDDPLQIAVQIAGVRSASWSD